MTKHSRGLGDVGDLYILNGSHIVNRIGHCLTELPAPEGIDVWVRFPVADELELGYPEPEVRP